MGPLLFLAFINDLPDAASSPVKLFADDCLIFRTIKSASDTTILQQDLTALDSWGKGLTDAIPSRKMCHHSHHQGKKKTNQSGPHLTATPLKVFQEANT
jgi:hypothetical protein